MKYRTADYSNSRRTRILLAVVLLGSLIFISLRRLSNTPVGLHLGLIPLNAPERLKFLKEESITAQSKNSSDTIEKFEVYYPDVVKKSYGKSKAQQKLKHTFGNSWGSPFVVDYIPPKEEFNKVVITLNTEVEGVQFDRLAHLFIDGVQVWRTSTIEPGGLKAHSSFTKDISDYSTLFKNEAKVVFQLDNIVNSKYTGEFHIELIIDYYFDQEFDSIEKNYTKVSDIISFKGEASRIVPLGKAAENILSPLSYFPEESLEFKFPRLNSNTSNVQLSIFTSGNADEEFWYANSVDRFAGNEQQEIKTFGHGPIRNVEVYINGKLLYTHAADPYIFTGGISPALWSPVVAFQTFDLKSIDLDLSSILPELDQADVEIIIDNGIDHRKVGSNWITTANLHIWEDENIKGNDGKITKIKPKRECNQILYGSKNSYEQVIGCDDTVEIFSDLTYFLSEGSISSSIEYKSDTGTSNIQSVKNNGGKQSIVHSSTTTRLIIIDLYKIFESFSYPIVLDMAVVEDDGDVTFDISIVRDVSHLLKSKEELLFKEFEVQNGTSTFVISPNGNHGSGKTETRYKHFDLEEEEQKYQRRVIAENNVVILDEVNEPFPEGDRLLEES